MLGCDDVQELLEKRSITVGGETTKIELNPQQAHSKYSHSKYSHSKYSQSKYSQSKYSHGKTELDPHQVLLSRNPKPSPSPGPSPSPSPSPNPNPNPNPNPTPHPNPTHTGATLARRGRQDCLRAALRLRGETLPLR